MNAEDLKHLSMSMRGGFYGFSNPEVRLVLLGNIGCGKTSSADTILSQVSHVSLDTARSCKLRQGGAEGRDVTVVEGPRWYWSHGSMEDGVKMETERAMTLAAPGPHAILLLVPVGQFTEMEGRVPAELEELLGEDALNHSLVLLTCGDYLMGRTPEEYLQKEHPGLRQMIERCGGRYHVFNNRMPQDRQQVRELLEKVDIMVQKNEVYHMKTLEERELDRRVKQRKKELMESFRAQQEEKRRANVSLISPNTETLSRREEHVLERRREERDDMDVLERRRREERDDMEGRMDFRQVSNGLHSTPAPERQLYSDTRDDGQSDRRPSFKLNADGALLSQISDVKSSPKIVSTFHHRINSFEERSPEASPTSSPRSPVFHQFPSSSSPTFTTSPSVFSSSSASPSSFSSSSSSSPELRLVLLGRSGAGKSAAGNAILGQQEFESRPESLTSITQKCEKKKALVEGRKVAVVDTPDWFHSEQTPDEVRAQISSCVALASPGPHAFLLCVPIDQPAKTELQALQALETVFGPDAVQRHTLVLFTYADRLRNSGKVADESMETYIASQRGDLLKLVEKCGDRFHVMETEGGLRRRRNVGELLEKVEQSVKEAGGQSYSCPAFQEAENKVRERQVELAREMKSHKQDRERVENAESRVLYSYMQPVSEAEEEVREDELEIMRDEAEKSVGTMNIESLPPIVLSSMSPSLLQSIREKMEASVKMLPKLLADGSVLVGEGAKKVKDSPMWGTVGSGAQNVQKMVADSALWGKVGSTAGTVSKAVGDRVPKVVVDSSAWVGSGAKAVAANPVWGKVGSGAKSGAKIMADSSARLGAGIGSGAKAVAANPVWGKVGSGAKSGAKIMADSSVRLGAGIGSGAKNLAQSPMWGKVGSGARSGAKMMADGSMKVGAGIGAGAKKVAQSPVWGQLGSGAKSGAKRVAESPVWEKMWTTAKKVPVVVMLGGVLGLVLGVFLGGAVGGAIGAAAGSAATEVGRRKYGNSSAIETTNEAARNFESTINSSVDSMVRQGEKVLKAE